MKKMVLAIFIIVLASCAAKESLYIRNGKVYGVTSGLFRDRWWNYYERGLSFAEGEFYEHAIRDLKTAIGMRRQDQWKSRTYGMHFITYFPHRELGVIYYRLKRFDDAQQEFEYSLMTAESSKAKHFLNKTRKSILEETGEDKLSPNIKINYPIDGLVTNEFSITLNGEAEDDYFIGSVDVDHIPFPLDLSMKKVLFEKELPLKSGINEIRIHASDLMEKTSERILKILVDREGPIIIIEDQKIMDQKIILSGFLTDNTGIVSFTINGQKIKILDVQNKGKNHFFHVSGQLLDFYQEVDLKDDRDIIILKAEDICRNITKAELHIESRSSRSNRLPMLASSYPQETCLDLGQYAFLGKDLGKIFDDVPPEIHVKDWMDFQTVYFDTLFIECHVSDESKIKSLMINGESILKRKGKKVFFNYLIRLKEGNNRFFIEATDFFGNKSQSLLIFNMKIPQIRQIGSRMSIFILPLKNERERSSLGDALYDNLIAAFVNQRRFHLIEREKMEEVLEELKLSQTELADPGTASRIGKIVIADAILTGSIYESKNSIEVITRLVDIETCRIIAAKDVFVEDKSLQGIKILMEGLALKYKYSLPLLEGLVIKKAGKALITDLGEDKQIKRDMRLILFREGEELMHPVNGRALGSEPIEIGEAKVQDVYKEFSRAFIKKGEYVSVKILDKVITK